MNYTLVMNETRKLGFLTWTLLLLWPIASIITLLAFYANDPNYVYGQRFDSMVGTKYALTIIGHITAFIGIPVALLTIISTRKVKSIALFYGLIAVMILVFCMQLFFRSNSMECIGAGCQSENLPDEFNTLLNYLIGATLLVLSVALGFISKKKLF